jgi:hypothetical protein
MDYALLRLGSTEASAAAPRDWVVCSTSCIYSVYAHLVSSEVNMAKLPANIYRRFINTHYEEVICIVSTQIKVVNTNFFLQNLCFEIVVRLRKTTLMLTL